MTLSLLVNSHILFAADKPANPPPIINHSVLIVSLSSGNLFCFGKISFHAAGPGSIGNLFATIVLFIKLFHQLFCSSH